VEGRLLSGGIEAALSIVTLGVADVDASAEFYARLGWERASSSQPGTIHWFALGGLWLGLFGREELAIDSGFSPAALPSEGQFSGVTLAINLPSQAATDAALRTALDAGARLTLPAVMTSYGVYHACFADLDGHVWEVAYNPFFPIVDGRTVIP
jgi:catechol 2,3-dioxygenase-like lactoylglutathione lyase family enzyme